MNHLANFVAHHNAVPIVLGILFLGTSAVLAASPDVRETVTGIVESPAVNASVLVDADLSHFNPQLHITDVREDDVNYYVTYRLDTYVITENTWGTIEAERTLVVEKAELGSSDLKAYALIQLQEVAQYEISYLKRAQSEAIASSHTTEEHTRQNGLAGLMVGLSSVLVPPDAKPAEMVKEKKPEESQPVGVEEETERSVENSLLVEETDTAPVLEEHAESAAPVIEKENIPTSDDSSQHPLQLPTPDDSGTVAP